MARGDLPGKEGSPALCACGCGEQLLSRRVYNRRGAIRASYLRPGHVIRLPGWNDRWYNEAQRIGRVRALRAYNESSCVPAQPVVSLLRARFGGPTAAAKFLGVRASTTQRLFHQTRMRRTNAERILRLLAGLPRLPTPEERDLSRREKARLARRNSPSRRAS